MHLVHNTRKFVNDLLSPSGFAITRTEKRPWKWRNQLIITRVGIYSIQVPAMNPVAWHYDQTPATMGQLGRLTTLLRGKYANLAAIDVGANVGDTACIIKSAEDIPLMCIEGDELTFGILQINITQFHNTTAHRIFLGEKTGVASVDFEKAGWNLTLKPGTSPSASVIKLISLDDFLATQPDSKAFKLLKIDTEGFDCSIIRGAENFIQNISPVITFEYNRGNMDLIGEPGLPTLFKLQEFGYSHIVFHDQSGRFLLSTKLEDRVLIQDLCDYADCVHGRIGYLDITAFHASDTELAETFVKAERSHRAK